MYNLVSLTKDEIKNIEENWFNMTEEFNISNFQSKEIDNTFDLKELTAKVYIMRRKTFMKFFDVKNPPCSLKVFDDFLSEISTMLNSTIVLLDKKINESTFLIPENTILFN